MYDPRAVANCVISLSVEYDRTVTHLSLQKILYFVHGRHLIERLSTLVDGHFEAWQYGPVHPTIYSACKTYGSKRLIDPLKSFNFLNSMYYDITEIEDKDVRLFVRSNAARFFDIPVGRLVDLSHAPGSPWDVLTKRESGNRIYGDRITNDLIRDLFGRHIVSVRDNPLCGEPLDEQPPS